MKKVLVTGAGGLLGKEVVRLLSDTHEVYALVRQRPADPLPGVRYLEIDLSGHWDAAALPTKIDAVAHLSQSSRFREFPEQALDIFQVNVTSTARLLDYALGAGVACFVLASSGGVYGAGSEAFHEDSPLTPPEQLGYYLASKLCGEALAQSYARLMKLWVLRFFFIYGPGQNRTMLVPRLVDSVRTGRPVAIQGSEGTRVNPVHVYDAARSVLRALEAAEGGVCNVAGPQVVSIRGLCDEISAHVGRKAVFQQQPGEPRDILADTKRMEQLLWTPRIRPTDGLKGLVE